MLVAYSSHQAQALRLSLALCAHALVLLCDRWDVGMRRYGCQTGRGNAASGACQVEASQPCPRT